MNLAELLAIVFGGVLAIFIGIFCIPVLKWGALYLSTRLSAVKWSLLEAKAVMIVKALKQAPQFSDKDNIQRKEYAINYVKSVAQEIGLEVPHTEIDYLIEAAALDLTKP